jgi:hypothetical protein
MRWKPQVDDEANKGLHILKDLMLPVAKVSNMCVCVCVWLCVSVYIIYYTCMCMCINIQSEQHRLSSSRARPAEPEISLHMLICISNEGANSRKCIF